MAAVVFLLACAALHVRVQPYAYEVQNTLETWLFVSDVMFVSLGIGYSFMDPNDPNRDVAEPLLVLLLLGTLVGAAVYLSWHHRCYLQNEVRDRAMTMRKTMATPRMRAVTSAQCLHSKPDVSSAAVEISATQQSLRPGSKFSCTGSDHTSGSVRSNQAGSRKSLVSAGI